MSKIGIVIEREYLERVKKKSFIITTILMPILMLALMMAPAAIMLFVDSSESKVLVVDNSKMIAQKLKDREDVKFELAHDITLDSALNREDVSSVLVIPANVINAQRSTLKLYSNGPSSITTESAITDQVNSIIETERLKKYNIENLDTILSEVSSNVALSTVRNDKEDEEAMSSGFSYAIGIGMAFILYMFLLIYGQMVMTSIIEEKGNRVLEVVVSSGTLLPGEGGEARPLFPSTNIPKAGGLVHKKRVIFSEFVRAGEGSPGGGESLRARRAAEGQAFKTLPP